MLRVSKPTSAINRVSPGPRLTVTTRTPYDRFSQIQSQPRDVNRSRRNKCFICSSELNDVHHVTWHSENVDGIASKRPPSYQCIACEYRTSSSLRLKKHEELHASDSAVKCNLCGKLCMDERKLKRHFEFTHADKLYSCYACQARFRQKCDLTKHVVRMHVDNLPCSLCENQINDVNHVAWHSKLGESGFFRENDNELKTEDQV